jgi:hypothetical protein
MNEAPAVEVHILDSRESSGGIEETAVSAVPPAVVNAIFAATGMRLRSLPVAPADLEQPACATHRGVCGTSPASSDRREEWQPVHLRGERLQRRLFCHGESQWVRKSKNTIEKHKPRCRPREDRAARKGHGAVF